MDPTDVNYTGARWQPSAFSVGGLDASITVNGNVDVAVRGTAVQTNTYSKTDDKMLGCKLSTISLLGDSIKIETPSDERNEDGSLEGSAVEPNSDTIINFRLFDMVKTPASGDLSDFVPPASVFNDGSDWIITDLR